MEEDLTMEEEYMETSKVLIVNDSEEILCVLKDYYGENYCLCAMNDNGEPEDNAFSRDYHWIDVALERAYQEGRESGIRDTQACLPSSISSKEGKYVPIDEGLANVDIDTLRDEVSKTLDRLYVKDYYENHYPDAAEHLKTFSRDPHTFTEKSEKEDLER